ncbi:hypothetical protein [uncultured Lacinutrix sp.]|uniref:hypothetical protein n=1 Tax=uncultured Lacinutrix sp. TaxID=574032 RepID=UPI002622D891|nr:hypothetical protein [uncultured Lacinutrix sp.]
MNTFIKKVIKFVLLVTVVFSTLHITLDYFFKNGKFCNNTWSEIFKANLDVDIAVIGNSRAEVHYNPEIISSITGLKCYNLGLSGTPINIYDIRWKSYINRNKLPKILIIDLDYNFLGEGKGIYEKFQYLPYVNEIEYQHIAQRVDKDFNLDQYLPLYKYQGEQGAVFSKLKSFFYKDCKESENGYKVKNKSWNENEWNIFKAKRMNEVANSDTFYDLYKKGHLKLNEILDFCKQNKIKTYLVWSPQYFEVHKFKENQRQYVDSLINNIASNYDIDYLNFSRDSLVYNKSNFYNHSHLNYKGAKLFSKSIAAHIKNKASL